MENNNPPFKIGDKVVCIESGEVMGGCGNVQNGSGLIKGEVYEIEGMVPPLYKQWGVILVEVKSTHYSEAFLASRFRKVEYDLSNSVSKELAQEALIERIETDVEVKELQN